MSTSAGAYGPGQERAPAVFRAHDLTERLRRPGRPDVVDAGDGALRLWRPDSDHPAAANVSDCTVELGTVAGALGDGTSTVALAYVDLDADLNTPQTGDGILDWMGVAHVLGLPGTEPELTSLTGGTALLSP